MDRLHVYSKDVCKFEEHIQKPSVEKEGVLKRDIFLRWQEKWGAGRKESLHYEEGPRAV